MEPALIDRLLQAGVVVGTLVLAGATFWLARAARAQIGLSKEALELTAAGVAESAKSRIDAQAPRVICFVEPPDWPPFYDPRRSRMPGGDEPALLDPGSVRSAQSISGGQEFSFPRDENHFLWFVCHGLIRNEGSSTALVRLGRQGRFVIDPGPFESITGEGPLDLPSPMGRESDRRRILNPGQTAVFRWAGGRPLKEWANAYEERNPPNPNKSLFFELIVRDEFDDGITDFIHIEVAGLPIESVDDQAGVWRLVPESPMVAFRYPIRRRYRKIDPQSPPKPPWAERYDGSE